MKHPIINKILTEWSYRVNNGMPNPKNPVHLVHLRETLQYLKIDTEVIDIMMTKLYEDSEDREKEKKKKLAKSKGLVNVSFNNLASELPTAPVAPNIKILPAMSLILF